MRPRKPVLEPITWYVDPARKITQAHVDAYNNTLKDSFYTNKFLENQTIEGMTPCHFAVLGNAYKSLKYLLSEKSKHNVLLDTNGRSPADYIFISGNLKLATLFLEYDFFNLDNLAKSAIKYRNKEVFELCIAKIKGNDFIRSLGIAEEHSDICNILEIIIRIFQRKIKRGNADSFERFGGCIYRGSLHED